MRVLCALLACASAKSLMRAADQLEVTSHGEVSPLEALAARKWRKVETRRLSVDFKKPKKDNEFSWDGVVPVVGLAVSPNSQTIFEEVLSRYDCCSKCWHQGGWVAVTSPAHVDTYHKLDAQVHCDCKRNAWKQDATLEKRKQSAQEGSDVLTQTIPGLRFEPSPMHTSYFLVQSGLLRDARDRLYAEAMESHVAAGERIHLAKTAVERAEKHEKSLEAKTELTEPLQVVRRQLADLDAKLVHRNKLLKPVDKLVIDAQAAKKRLKEIQAKMSALGARLEAVQEKIGLNTGRGTKKNGLVGKMQGAIGKMKDAVANAASDERKPGGMFAAWIPKVKQELDAQEKLNEAHEDRLTHMAGLRVKMAVQHTHQTAKTEEQEATVANQLRDKLQAGISGVKAHFQKKEKAETEDAEAAAEADAKRRWHLSRPGVPLPAGIHPRPQQIPSPAQPRSVFGGWFSNAEESSSFLEEESFLEQEIPGVSVFDRISPSKREKFGWDLAVMQPMMTSDISPMWTRDISMTECVTSCYAANGGWVRVSREFQTKDVATCSCMPDDRSRLFKDKLRQNDAIFFTVGGVLGKVRAQIQETSESEKQKLTARAHRVEEAAEAETFRISKLLGENRMNKQVSDALIAKVNDDVAQSKLVAGSMKVMQKQVNSVRGILAGLEEIPESEWQSLESEIKRINHKFTAIREPRA